MCDYTLPQFNAIKALEIVKNTKSDLPCIIISGTIGEETAVSAMLAGAKDYFVKGRLTRLNVAINRELNETENRRAKLKAEIELCESEKSRWLEREEALKRETDSHKKIESLYAEAQEANRTKDEFLHRISPGQEWALLLLLALFIDIMVKCGQRRKWKKGQPFIFLFNLIKKGNGLSIMGNINSFAIMGGVV